MGAETSAPPMVLPPRTRDYCLQTRCGSLSAQSYCAVKETVCAKQTHCKFTSNKSAFPFDKSSPKQGSSQGERRRGGEELRRLRWSSPPHSSTSEMVLPPRKKHFAPNRPTVSHYAQSINPFSCYFLVANKKVAKEYCQKPSVSTKVPDLLVSCSHNVRSRTCTEHVLPLPSRLARSP